LTCINSKGNEPAKDTLVNVQVGGNLTIIGSKGSATTKGKKAAPKVAVAAKVENVPTVQTAPKVETAEEKLAKLIAEMLSGKR
jgi:hypothetical protein